MGVCEKDEIVCSMKEDTRFVRRAVINLAWPVMLQHFFMSLMFLSDTIMLGRYRHSELALAAVGLAGPITMMIRLTLMCVPIAIIAMVSRSYGEKNDLKTSVNASAGLMVVLIIGIVVSILGFTLSGNIIACFTDPSSDLYKESVTYLSITLSVFVMNYLFLISTAILRGVGNTRTPLIITIFTNILNIIGDYILIFGKLGFPEMGVKGAAISTFISSVIEGVIILVYLFSARSGLNLSLKGFRLVEMPIFKTLFRIGLPAGIEPIITHLGGLVFLKIVAGISQTALATHYVITRIESLSFMPVMGLSIATGALVGQYIGARKSNLANITLAQSISFSHRIMLSLCLLFLLFPSFIISIFTTNINIREVGFYCLMIAAIEQPFLGYAMVHQGTFRGAGNTVIPLIINFIGVWLIRLPLAFLFVNVFHLGLLGAWLTMPIDWLIRSIVYRIMFKKGKWAKIDLT
ncbi:MAG: MATE family efflux transporter [Planctomycetota bacterium]|nr:MATE family efflux transporter [Planctomycetota bacterium]MDI6788043.1 MATE family efflux transporter [Planctomycetota bacterium]